MDSDGLIIGLSIIAALELALFALLWVVHWLLRRQRRQATSLLSVAEQRGYGHLAEQLPICHGEAPELPKPELGVRIPT